MDSKRLLIRAVCALFLNFFGMSGDQEGLFPENYVIKIATLM